MNDWVERSPVDGKASGLEILKKVWNISDRRAEREPAPKGVCTDIYALPGESRDVPRRRYPTR